MIYTLTLLGIYILSVLVIYGVSLFRPHTLSRLHPVLIVALFSFVPAVAVGREMLLRTELWKMVSVVPTWLSIGLSALFVVGIIPVRSWIRKEVLERTAEGARQFLDSLPERMMSIEAAESRREISMDEAAARKTQVQRDVDRVSAIDAVGRFLYLLLKLHLVRIGFQILGAVVVESPLKGGALRVGGFETVTTVWIDTGLIFAPLLILMGLLLWLRPAGGATRCSQPI